PLFSVFLPLGLLFFFSSPYYRRKCHLFSFDPAAATPHTPQNHHVDEPRQAKDGYAWKNGDNGFSRVMMQNNIMVILCEAGRLRDRRQNQKEWEHTSKHTIVNQGWAR